jgi:hypothetical protein
MHNAAGFVNIRAESIGREKKSIYIKLNMKTRIAASFVLSVIMSAPLSAIPQDLVPAMAALDRAYIPALGQDGVPAL